MMYFIVELTREVDLLDNAIFDIIELYRITNNMKYTKIYQYSNEFH